ncbi:uncharacterized protein TM35_000341720 [Trypanosoma theileri]|uniref:CCDC81 HU domain-containing protein n=1 Tax=Trypanosoma theileri TaxID=67003 RepID=A0A1X0NN44_9TRYP|nr:uncharacterized protein TM35_000341720 [Trypanosoma theileri]ORC85560.1 hypothetical protein TM35_000341720 [Trypanosoma theileri]
MLSVLGAITNNLVMVECTSSQERCAKKEVFLLSELERAWDALSTVIRHHLIEGHNVRITNFGCFWIESRAVVSDGVERYHARRIHFGIDNNFALRYNIDPIKVPQEPSRLEYVKISMAEVVAIAGVPARTASMALREFFSYVGEGLFRHQVFNITFPGVASLTIKREKAVLEVEESLRREMFAIDARRWPLAVREAAEAVVLAPSRPPSATPSASRPNTSRCSRPSTAARPLEPRPAFVPSAPRNRLFSEIEKDPPRRPPLRGAHVFDEAISQEGDMNGMNAAYVKESVFDALDPEEYPQPDEPEIEVIEEVDVEPLLPLRAYEEVAPRPLTATVRYSIHDHSSVRDLLCGKAAPTPDPLTRGRRRYINRDSDEVAALMKIS